MSDELDLTTISMARKVTQDLTMPLLAEMVMVFIEVHHIRLSLQMVVFIEVHHVRAEKLNSQPPH